MISGGDIANGVRAAFAMARDEEGWQDRFDFSADQVFKSFWAIGLSLPAIVLSAEVSRQVAASAPPDPFTTSIASISPATLAVSQVLSFSVLWAVELWMLMTLAKRRNIGWKVSPLIISYNWSKFLFAMVVALPLGVSILTGATALGTLGSTTGHALLLFLRWGIFRRTLDLTPIGVIGVLALLILAYFVMSMLSTGLLVFFGLMELPQVSS
ncbi:hypothetical protein [Parvularcula lutaonensis]|uniref:Yip1 domain-containing protein n=1 Tax=Parvularcula lutaonensis TaxID=491923 RepID=A0ABV7MDQ1_9PROT|nr:hypothetical protein [Parvularcula lutaonensis]GGY37515.1 hypothetical protein GCM10007148_02230 [Parvularcula lutaonensis]